MTDLPVRAASGPRASSDRQRATATLRLGRRTRAKLTIDVTPLGMAAAGGVTAAILLSTAWLVRTAIREAKRRPIGPHT